MGNGIGAKPENNNVDLNIDLAEVRLISIGGTRLSLLSRLFLSCFKGMCREKITNQYSIY